MEKVVYSLKMKKDTEELHLFEATPTELNKCTPKNNSICNKMSRAESSGDRFVCSSEEKARIECANIGRNVCGICVSHLYESYER